MRCAHWLNLTLLFCLAGVPPGSAQPSPAGPPDDSGSSLIAVPRQVLRTLAEHGLSFQGQLVHDWSKNLSSGADPAYGFGRYSFDLSARVESEKSLGWPGGTGLVRLKQHIREFGWTNAGAAQLYSNIDASSRTSLYELWFEQKALHGKLRLKGGKIDANTEFAVVENGADFLNSSMGFSPTILAFPTYPEPQPGGGIFFTSTRGYGLALGMFRSTMGTLSIAEPRLRWSVGERELPGRVGAGYWRLDGSMHCFDGRTASVHHGFYSVVEQGLWHSSQPGRNQAATSFLQLGQAGGDVSAFTWHIGGGVVWQSPLAARPDDGLGIAATWVQFSRQPGAGFEYSSEVIAEGYYKLIINRHLALVPDLQFLHHPGGLRANPDVAVFTPRLVISF